ncbi:hypothetical protein NLI96_g2801 [Meripilus lineatus]|uniref:RNA-dependent RNA polymerase n=1 Tax=Meripilus lineatus TaxID=2056292 RepID=A0AAD5VCL7_9APHY|nr:hypothetical protein NLI96_g2801 [Physisporinus lineatus]
MEIFVDNIAFSVSQISLKTEIAKVIHGREYQHHSIRPLNLHVHILPRKGNRTSRCGKLTLPTRAVAEQFLRDYGGPRPRRYITLKTRIKFSPSRSNPRHTVLEEIIRLPFVDPAAEMQREINEHELKANTIGWRTLEFGWECRDSVFSTEWGFNCEEPGEVEYDQDRRIFRLKLLNQNTTHIVAIFVTQVKWVSAMEDESGMPVIFFSLLYPPSYETYETQSLEGLQYDLINANLDESRLRQRWSAIDTSHAELSAYTSLAIRVVCQSKRELESFRRMCRIARLDLERFTYPVVIRGLFSPSARSLYGQWCCSLPFRIGFQVESIMRDMLLDMREMLSLRAHIGEVQRSRGVQFTVNLLRNFATQAKDWYSEGSEASQTPIADVKELFVRCMQHYAPPTPRRFQTGLADTFDCLHVTVTPTTYKLSGPFPERSNRIMRQYPHSHDSFLRVTFLEETKLQFRFDREVDGRKFIERRLGSLLKNGIWIAGRRFDFLAYSQSALKEHAVWFVKPFSSLTGEKVTAETIIHSIGTFEGLQGDPDLILCPARYGARISQAFTATDSSVSVQAEEIITLDDIKTADGQWCFTDGVGTISPDLARAIWRELRARRKRVTRVAPYPRAFQIRFQGSKGMLSVDHRLSGRAICLRPSMIKFEAPHSLDVEIARAFDKPGLFYLNRPLIMILEGLGVRFEVFHELQKAAVAETNRSKESLSLAARLLERYGLGTAFHLTSVMLNLDKLGVGPLVWDSFWNQMMDFAINHVLRELKHRARIPVPGAWNLVGVADIHGYLQEDQIFVHIAPTNGEPASYLEGPTLVSRSPTIHPGDVRVVHAIGKPPPGSPFEKESLRNCIVFSTRGSRPLPSCLGGGDLDGDVYLCTTLRSLQPPYNWEPAPYTPAVRKTLDHPSTMSDVADFVMEYISSDVLGIVAINWLIIADQSPMNIFDEDCMKLAELHSDAVDYPKSGQPVSLSQIPKLKFRVKPDWNAPETLPSDNPDFYKSERAIGRLFRDIKLPALQTVERVRRAQSRVLNESQEVTTDTIIRAFRQFEPEEDDFVTLAVQGRVMSFISTGTHDQDTISEVWEIFERYTSELSLICYDNTLGTRKDAMLTEEEAIVGTIVAKSSQPRMRKDKMSRMRDQTTLLVRSVSHELAGEDGTLHEKSLERAWVAYQLACIEQKDGYFGAKSFGWIALGEIFDAIRDIEESEGL